NEEKLEGYIASPHLSRRNCSETVVLSLAVVCFARPQAPTAEAPAEEVPTEVIAADPAANVIDPQFASFIFPDDEPAVVAAKMAHFAAVKVALGGPPATSQVAAETQAVEAEATLAAEAEGEAVAAAEAEAEAEAADAAALEAEAAEAQEAEAALADAEAAEATALEVEAAEAQEAEA
ncbi:putative Cytochrome c1-like 2, partial [Homarus americanus]